MGCFWTDLRSGSVYRVTRCDGWRMASYLSNRCQLISIQGKLSIPMPLIYGVPQGSVLGPLLFILYTTPLSQIITKFKDLQHHLYADDTQIFTSFITSNHSNKIKSLQKSLISVQDWMFTNKLKLNPDKAEFMLIGNKCHCNKFDSKFPVDILNNSISLQLTPRILA